MKKALPAVCLTACLAASAPPAARAEEKSPAAFGISFSGYVKTDVFYDSRQTVGIREGHYLLYPKGPDIAPDGSDVNSRPTFHMLSIQTRLAGRITGPDVLGARSSAYIETEFFGTSESDLNGFRLRHAFARLEWKRSELMVGQFWHPLFVTESFPDVVSFNTGAPFQPFNRSPQARFTWKPGRLSVTATALSQRDFTSTGPDGPSTAYIRNAALPEFNLKAQWSAKDEARGTETLAGASADFLKIAPRLKTAAGYPADETLGTFAGAFFFKRRWPGLTFKFQAVYGQNLHHLTMLGGYGVRGVTDDIRLSWDYAPFETLSFWAEAHTNGQTWQTGVFAGYCRNLGATRPVPLAVYARGADIASAYRVSPRLVRNAGKTRLAAEAELTAAAYGAPDASGNVRDAAYKANLRLLVAVYYFF
jgi:hypothetical protein